MFVITLFCVLNFQLNQQTRFWITVFRAFNLVSDVFKVIWHLFISYACIICFKMSFGNSMAIAFVNPFPPKVDTCPISFRILKIKIKVWQLTI